MTPPGGRARLAAATASVTRRSSISCPSNRSRAARYSTDSPGNTTFIAHLVSSIAGIRDQESVTDYLDHRAARGVSARDLADARLVDTRASKVPYFIAVVVLLSALLLLVVFRSLLIPLQAAVMNLLSIAAALGAVQAIFDRGWLGGRSASSPGSMAPAVFLDAVVIRSLLLARLVLVVAPHPERFRCALVATPRRAVEQGVVGHRGLEAAGRAHVRPVDGPVRQGVHAQARSLCDVSRGVSSAHARVLFDGGRYLALQERPQLLLRVEEAEVTVEIAAAARNPVDAPAHSFPIGDQLRKRRAGSEQQSGVLSL